MAVGKLKRRTPNTGAFAVAVIHFNHPVQASRSIIVIVVVLACNSSRTLREAVGACIAGNGDHHPNHPEQHKHADNDTDDGERLLSTTRRA
jgi:hypothetical protein